MNVFRRSGHSVSRSSVATAGSAELIERLAHEHYGMVYKFCARRIGTERAADAAQETFVTAIRAIANFRGESEAKTWLLGIANNECRRIIRRDQSASLAIEFDLDLVPQASEETRWIDREVLRDALAELSDDHRDAVIMKEVDGLTYEEIGLILGIPSGTIKSRVHHGMLQLRSRLRGQL